MNGFAVRKSMERNWNVLHIEPILPSVVRECHGFGVRK
jgi:hypothetical protein